MPHFSCFYSRMFLRRALHFAHVWLVGHLHHASHLLRSHCCIPLTRSTDEFGKSLVATMIRSLVPSFIRTTNKEPVPPPPLAVGEPLLLPDNNEEAACEDDDDDLSQHNKSNLLLQLLDSNPDSTDSELDKEHEMVKSPTHVAELLPTPEEEENHSAAAKTAALVSEGVDLLDQLESHYRSGLSRRLTGNLRKDGEQVQEQEQEGRDDQRDGHVVNDVEEQEKKEEEETASVTSNTTDSFDVDEKDNKVIAEKPSSPTPRSWVERRVRHGESISKEQALELTVEKLTRQLEDMMEQRDSLQINVHNLEGKVEAQQAKIEALEYFFRKVNNRDDEASVTSFTSFSSSGSFHNKSHSATAAVDVDDAHRDGDDQDEEAWELEGGAPKLSRSFKKTEEKMRSAKSRAAIKMSKIVCV